MFGFGEYWFECDYCWIVVFGELVVEVEYVGYVVGYVGCEVVIGNFEYCYGFVGYVFVVVVFYFFDYCLGIGVVYGKVFVCYVVEVCFFFDCFI